jgi:hypothetical protein
MHPSRSLCLGSWGAIVALSCTRQPGPDPKNATSMAEPSSAVVTLPIDSASYDPIARAAASPEAGEAFDDAVRDIAATFCSHEQVCDNVGPHRSYSTRENCIGWEEGMRRVALQSSICGRRVPRASVVQCLDVLRGSPCMLAGDGASRVAECRAGALCAGE